MSKHVFLQYSLKTNRLKLMMTSTRKLAHHCLHRVKANLTFPSFQLQVTDWQARSSTVQCWRLTPLLRASLPQISPAGALLTSSSSSPSALLYALTLPPHPRLGPNAFLRPLVLKIRVNPDQLKSPPSVSLFFSTQVKNNIRVSLILFSPVIIT